MNAASLESESIKREDFWSDNFQQIKCKFLADVVSAEQSRDVSKEIETIEYRKYPLTKQSILIPMLLQTTRRMRRRLWAAVTVIRRKSPTMSMMLANVKTSEVSRAHLLRLLRKVTQVLHVGQQVSKFDAKMSAVLLISVPSSSFVHARCALCVSFISAWR
jgi:hypothetical protein